MNEFRSSGDQYQNWSAPKSRESRAVPGVIKGEINQNKEVDGKPREASNLESAVKTKMVEFSAIIEGALKDKKEGAGLSPAEAEGIRNELRNKAAEMKVGGDIIKEIKAADYHDTGRKIIIPMDTGDATFKLSIFRDTEQSKFKFQLEAVNDLARKLESN